MAPTILSGKMLVDLTIDGGVQYSSSPQTIHVIDPPEIVNINNTNYYYTHNELVFI